VLGAELVERVVGAVLVILSIVIGYSLVEIQQRLEASQDELENAKHAANEAAAELGKRLASLNSALKLNQPDPRLRTSSIPTWKQSELENTKQAAGEAKAQAAGLRKRVVSINSALEKASALGNAGDPATSYIEIGDVLMAQGNLTDALKW
jgi:hypothetical protein